jgi:predicted nucleotidyltransferase
MTETPPEFTTALSKVEQAHDVQIIAARDTGSRAWGLDGPESDYDVDFLFTQPPVEYATVGEYEASITTTHGEKLELSGWNVKRFAELLIDSNPSVVEFLHSSLRYRDHEALDRLESAVADEFDPLTLYHHYRSLARNQHRKYIQRVLLDGDDPEWLVVASDEAGYDVRPVDSYGPDASGPDTPQSEPKRVERPTELRAATTDRCVKRNLYVGRAALAARYVLATHEFPPLQFSAMLDELATLDQFGELGRGAQPGRWIEAARELAEKKRAGEGGETVGDAFGAEVIPPTEIDHERHGGGGIDVERVNQFVAAVVTTW